MRKFDAKIGLTFIVISILMFAIGGCAAGNFTSYHQNEDTNTAILSSSVGSENAVIETDREILMREGHPQWLDDMSGVYATWQDAIDSGKIVIPGAWDVLYGDTHILEISEFSSNYDEDGTEYIGEIIFHFSNFDTQLTLEDALSIVSTYLPQDLIQQYYNEERSFYEVNNGDYPSIRYVKCYRLINEGTEIPEHLNTTFDILIWTDVDGNVTEAKIASVGFADFDNIQDWDFDFFTQ